MQLPNCVGPLHAGDQRPPPQEQAGPLEDDYDPEQAASRSGKIGALDDLLTVLTAPEESALIFTRYRSMAKFLLRHLRSHGHDPLYYSGDIPSVRERQRVIDTFRARSGQLMVRTVNRMCPVSRP